MMLTWYDEYVEQLTYHMSHPRQQTGRLPIYGGTADKVTDDSGKQYEVINIRIDHEGIPVTLNIGLPQIGSLETETAEAKAAGLDEAAEAGGYSCYQHLQPRRPIAATSSSASSAMAKSIPFSMTATF